jgi:hypothetical protein
MDHLPHLISPVAVPYLVLSHHSYDSLGFLEFPSRIHTSVYPPDNNHHLSYLSLVQSHLFFGFLLEVLRIPGVVVTVEDFIERRGEEVVVTTRNLPVFLWYWALRVRKQEREEREMDRHALYEILEAGGNRYRHTLHRMTDDNDSLQQQNSFFPILLSIAILGETLSQTFSHLYHHPLSPTWPICPLLTSHLLQSGYCPYEITLLSHHLGLGNTGLYYYFLSGGVYERDGDEGKHKKCEGGVCKVLYEGGLGKHVREGCACQFLAGDRDVEDMILNEEIPLVTYNPLLGREASDLHQVPFRTEELVPSSNELAYLPFSLTASKPPNTPYVILSHVSQGLGSPDTNTLPRCQLQRLQRYCDALFEDKYRPVRFWIDAMCMPLPSARTRIEALSLLKHTYYYASKTLILDPLLLRTPIREIETQIPLLRILTSTWSRRLWPLVEGMLSKNLYFQFQDGSIGIEDLVKRGSFLMEKKEEVQRTLGNDLGGLREVGRRGYPMDITRDDWSWIATQREEVLWDIGLNHLPSILRFHVRLLQNPTNNKPLTPSHFLLTHFQNRTSHNPSDEAICILLLLGLDIHTVLLKSKMEDIIPQLVTSVKSVPMQLLFQLKPRFTEYGDRWIPRTFLGGADEWKEFDEMTTWGEKGLEVNTLASYMLEIVDPGFPLFVSEMFLSLNDNPGLYNIYPLDTYSNIITQTPATVIDWTNHFILHEMAIILHPGKLGSGERFGALVSIIRREGPIVYAMFEMVVWMRRATREVLAQGVEANVHGRAVAAGQRWCIG